MSRRSSKGAVEDPWAKVAEIAPEDDPWRTSFASAAGVEDVDGAEKKGDISTVAAEEQEGTPADT